MKVYDYFSQPNEPKDSSFSLDSSLPPEALPPPATLCQHNHDPAQCLTCDRILAAKELYDLLGDWRKYLKFRQKHPRKSYNPFRTLSITEEMVWPQHYDFSVPGDATKSQQAIASKHWVADIRIKRNIKLSHGVSASRGMSGYLLGDSCVTDVLNALFIDSVPLRAINRARNAISLGHHWIFANQFLFCIPQIESQKKIRDTKNPSTVKQIINYTITDKTRSLFDGN